MVYKNHRNTALLGGVAAISIVPSVIIMDTLNNEYSSQIIYLIYMIFLMGVFVGNKYGPDLDHPSSVARKDGALEIIIGLLLIIPCLLFQNYTAAIVVFSIYVIFGLLVQAKILKSDFRKIITIFTTITSIVLLTIGNLDNENYIYFLTFLPILVFTYIVINNGHRKFIHSLLFGCLICFSLLISGLIVTSTMEVTYLSGILFYLLIGYIFGFIWHLLMDSFSKSGVPFLYPFSKKNYGIPMYTTSSVKKVKNTNNKNSKSNKKNNTDKMTEDNFALLVIILMGISTVLGLLF